MSSFPYVFENQTNSIFPYTEFPEQYKNMGMSFLYAPKFQLKDGFYFAYQSLLKSISQEDNEMIDAFCESNLANEFNDSLADLRSDGLSLDLINEKNHSFELDLVGIQQLVGPKLDRKLNKGFKPMDLSRFMGAGTKDVIKVLAPTSNIDTIPLSLAMILKVKTNLKLNVVDKDRKGMIDYDDYGDEEVHFIRFESTFKEIEFSFQGFKETMRILKEGDFEFEDWIISDFDHRLSGNPFI